MLKPRLHAYIELMRIPNVFTAMADILAGYFFASLRMGTLGNLALLLGASSCLYIAGIVLNDYFDYDVDKLERPKRPLPSGRVRREMAFLLGVALLGIGCILAAAAGKVSAIIALMLAACIVSYDGLAKNIPIVGSVNMGLCRYLNFVLGMSLSPLNPARLAVPFLVMFYVVAITTLSKGEVAGKSRWPAIRAFIVLILVMIGFVFLNRSDILPNDSSLLIFALFSLIVLRYVVISIDRPDALNIGRAVKFLVLGLIPLDAIIVMGATDFQHGSIVLSLLVPSILLTRYFYVT